MLTEEIVALVVPPRCAACRAPGRRAADVLCAACRRGLPWLGRPTCPRCALPLAPSTRRHRCPARHAAFDAAWAAVAYDATARDAMHAMKFSAARPLARVMAAQIAANAPPALLGEGRATTIVPVPPHPRRRRARGFDAAELIAVALARRTQLEVRRPLRRAATRSHQLGASRAERRDPKHLHFRAHGAAPPQVLLVDDVHTTGATLHACASALRAAGSLSVAAITWARTLDERLVEPVNPEA